MCVYIAVIYVKLSQLISVHNHRGYFMRLMHNTIVYLTYGELHPIPLTGLVFILQDG